MRLIRWPRSVGQLGGLFKAYFDYHLSRKWSTLYPPD